MHTCREYSIQSMSNVYIHVQNTKYIRCTRYKHKHGELKVSAVCKGGGTPGLPQELLQKDQESAEANIKYTITKDIINYRIFVLVSGLPPAVCLQVQRLLRWRKSQGSPLSLCSCKPTMAWAVSGRVSPPACLLCA